jgi:hypothetical protein
MAAMMVAWKGTRMVELLVMMSAAGMVWPMGMQLVGPTANTKAAMKVLHWGIPAAAHWGMTAADC